MDEQREVIFSEVIRVLTNCVEVCAFAKELCATDKETVRALANVETIVTKNGEVRNFRAAFDFMVILCVCNPRRYSDGRLIRHRVPKAEEIKGLERVLKKVRAVKAALVTGLGDETRWSIESFLGGMYCNQSSGEPVSLDDILRALEGVVTFKMGATPLGTRSASLQGDFIRKLSTEIERQYGARLKDETVVVIMERVGLPERSPDLVRKVREKARRGKAE